MFAQSRMFRVNRAMPFLSPDGEGAGAGGAGAGSETHTTDTKADDPDKIEGLSDNDKEAFKRMRDQREAARAEARKAQEERDALLKDKTEREAAEAKARDEEATKKGEFEKLAAERQTALDTAKSENKALKADNDAMREAINGFLDAEWKALPAEVRDAYLGADDDPLAKLTFLPKGKALAEKLAGTAQKETKRGNGADPRASGSSSADNSAAQKAQRAHLQGVF